MRELLIKLSDIVSPPKPLVIWLYGDFGGGIVLPNPASKGGERMLDVAEALRGASVRCTCPVDEKPTGETILCDRLVPLRDAKVPDFRAIRALTKRSVMLDDLVASALCHRHAEMARREAENQKVEVKLYWFLASVRQLVAWDAENRAAKGFFGRFKTEDTRGNGRDNAFVPKLRRGDRRDYA